MWAVKWNWKIDLVRVVSRPNQIMHHNIFYPIIYPPTLLGLLSRVFKLKQLLCKIPHYLAYHPFVMGCHERNFVLFFVHRKFTIRSHFVHNLFTFPVITIFSQPIYSITMFRQLVSRLRLWVLKNFLFFFKNLLTNSPNYDTIIMGRGKAPEQEKRGKEKWKKERLNTQ